MQVFLFKGPLFCIGLSLWVLAGCASTPPAEPQPAKEQASAPRPTEPQAQPAKPPAPQPSLSGQSFYNLFLAEVAEQRSQRLISAQLTLQLAQMQASPELALLALQRAAQAEDLDTAHAAAGYLLTLEPEHLEAQRMLALTHLQRAELAQSLPPLQRWLDQDDRADYLSIYEASSRLSLEQGQQLIEALESRRSSPTPAQAELELTLGFLHEQFQSPAWQIIQHARDSLNRAPSSLAWQLLLRQQQGVALVDSADDALSEFPNSRSLRLQALESLHLADYSLAALSAAQDWLQRHPEDEGMRALAVQIALDSANWQSLLALAPKLEQSSDYAGLGWYARGMALAGQDKPDQAILAWQQTQVSEWFLPSQQQLAQTLWQQQGEQAALRQLALAKHQHPEQAGALWRLQAHLYAQRQQPKSVGRSLEAGWQALPQDLDLGYQLALWYFEQQQPEEGIAVLEALYLLAPDNTHILNALGYSLADQDQQLHRALDLISQALQAEPNNPAIQDSMAWVLYRLGQYEPALSWIERSLSQHLSAEIAYHHLAILLALDPNKAKAQAALYREQLNDPNIEKIHQQLHAR